MTIPEQLNSTVKKIDFWGYVVNQSYLILKTDILTLTNGTEDIMKKLCIFDFDGTMFDSISDVARCFNETFDELGYERLDLEYYRKSLGGNVDEIIGIILKDNNNAENVELVKKTYEKIYNNDLKENTHLFAGIHELLENLQDDGFVLAINSNRKTASIRKFIDRFAGDIDFVDIQGHEYSHPSKPDAYGVNAILEKSGISREDTVYIGDSATDVATSRNAGIDCIIVTWGYGMEDVYADEYPIAVVDNPFDILKIVKKE